MKSALYNHTPRLLCAAAVGIGCLLVSSAPADAATASAELKAGSLGFVSTPPNVTFPNTTLTGLAQVITATQGIDVGDATGSGAGWNLTATSTTFAAGGHTLPTTATTITSTPTVACDAGATGCTTATTTGLVSYPYSLPAAGTAPTATRMFNAAAASGMGNQTVTPTWNLAVPPSTYAGTYTSTWTVSLISAP
jgi:hypothetical protein